MVMGNRVSNPLLSANLSKMLMFAFIFHGNAIPRYLELSAKFDWQFNYIRHCSNCLSNDFVMDFKIHANKFDMFNFNKLII